MTLRDELMKMVEATGDPLLTDRHADYHDMLDAVMRLQGICPPARIKALAEVAMAAEAYVDFIPGEGGAERHAAYRKAVAAIERLGKAVGT